MALSFFSIDLDGIKVPVILEEDKRLPLKNLYIVFKDSGALASNKAGLASISASLLGEGTKKSGAIEFARELNNHAITLHVASGQETMVINFSAINSEYEFGIQKLKELFLDPNFTEEAFKKVTTQRIGKLIRQQSNFDIVASNNLRKLLFPNTPLANPEDGTIESIKSMKLEEVEKFIKSHLHLNNVVIVAGGDFSKEELINSIISFLKVLPKGEIKEIPHYQTNSKSKIETIYEDTDQAYIYFGSPFEMEANSTKRVYAKVASFILGSGGFGSRLMEEVRVKRGLAYSVYSNFLINKTNSYFKGFLQTKTSNAKEAKEVIIKLLENFVKNGVTQEELESAKKFYLGSEPLRNETIMQKMHRDFFEYYDGLGLGYHKKELKEIENMKLKDLNDFIKSHPEILNLSFSIVTKKENNK